MATYSSIFAWKASWTEEPGGLHPWGCKESDMTEDSYTHRFLPEETNYIYSSVTQSFSHIWLFVTPWTAACQASCPSPLPGAHSNSCLSRWWCHPTISTSVVPFSCSLQSFPVSGSFPMSQFFVSGGQSIGASATVLPMNTQDWFTLGLTGLIS